MLRAAMMFTSAAALSGNALGRGTLGRGSVRMASSFDDFEERLLAPSKESDGELVSMSSYAGQVVLVENVASL